MATSRKVGCAAAVAVVAVAMSGCGSDQDASQGDAGRPAGAVPAAPGAGLRQQTFDVVSFGVPTAVPMAPRAAEDGDPGVRRTTWVHETEGYPDCVVTVTVEPKVTTTIGAYQTYLETTDPASMALDPNAPKGVDAVIARYRGSETPSTGGSPRPFTSTLRTFLTRGGTKATISAVASTSLGGRCSPDAVAASFRWSGVESQQVRG